MVYRGPESIHMVHMYSIVVPGAYAAIRVIRSTLDCRHFLVYEISSDLPDFPSVHTYFPLSSSP